MLKRVGDLVILKNGHMIKEIKKCEWLEIEAQGDPE